MTATTPESWPLRILRAQLENLEATLKRRESFLMSPYRVAYNPDAKLWDVWLDPKLISEDRLESSRNFRTRRQAMDYVREAREAGGPPRG